MKILKILIIPALLALPGLLAQMSHVHAQSFDCRKARTPDEHAICADPYLAVKDRIIANLYFQIWDYIENYDNAMGELARLREAQRDFLRRRRRCGGDRKCIDHVQRQRILELLERYRRAFEY